MHRVRKLILKMDGIQKLINNECVKDREGKPIISSIVNSKIIS